MQRQNALFRAQPSHNPGYICPTFGQIDSVRAWIAKLQRHAKTDMRPGYRLPPGELSLKFLAGPGKLTPRLRHCRPATYWTTGFEPHSADTRFVDSLSFTAIRFPSMTPLTAPTIV